MKGRSAVRRAGLDAERRWRAGRTHAGAVAEDLTAEAPMTPDEFRSHGHRLIEWIADSRARLADRPVMARTAPGEVKGQLPASPPERPGDFEGVFRDLERVILPGLSHWQHPHFFGYFPANASLASVL